MNWRELSCVKTPKGQIQGEVCGQCLREQYKQRLIDEHFYTKKLLDDTFRKLSLLCENCGSDCVVMDGDLEVCGNCGTLQPAQVY